VSNITEIKATSARSWAHCTGIESVYLLRQRMGLTRRDAVVATVGATFDLSDGIHTGSIGE